MQGGPSNEIRLVHRRLSLDNGYTFHDVRQHTDLMRNIIILTASTGEVLIIAVFGSEDKPKIDALMPALTHNLAPTSLMYDII